jgi:hypothetical protein
MATNNKSDLRLQMEARAPSMDTHMSNAEFEWFMEEIHGKKEKPRGLQHWGVDPEATVIEHPQLQRVSFLPVQHQVPATPPPTKDSKAKAQKAALRSAVSTAKGTIEQTLGASSKPPMDPDFRHMLNNAMRGAAASAEQQGSVLYTFFSDLKGLFSDIVGVNFELPLGGQLQTALMKGNRLLSLGVFLLLLCVMWIVIMTLVYVSKSM